MRTFVLLSLAALCVVGNAKLFNIVHKDGTPSVYDVRGAVTVGSHGLTGERSALEYNGTIALQRVNDQVYLGKFQQFTVGKYDRIDVDIQDEGFGDQQEQHKQLKGAYEQELLKPVKFYMQNGQIVRMEAEKDHKQWALNIYRAVFTLLQNQVTEPRTLEVPHIEYTYENGVEGTCKVQYQVLSETEHGTLPGVYNITKTTDFKDCQGARPVYLHLKDTKRGCAGVCEGHIPENFLEQYEEEKTDFEMKPTPGCPVNGQRTDTLVTVHKVSQYNVTEGHLDAALSDSMDVYRLFGGELQVFTRLELYHEHGKEGHFGKIEEPKNVETYENLHLRLPREERQLDIPIYALMRTLTQQQKQAVQTNFVKHLEAVVRELVQLKETGKNQQRETEANKAPAQVVELIQAISGMTFEEIQQVIPEVVRRAQPKKLSEQEHLLRQLWIELLGKAGSKASVKITTDMIKRNIFTAGETRRLLQDIASFQSYPDTEMIEHILDVCTGEHKLTGTGKATACVAAGKIISKACHSKVITGEFEQRQGEHEKNNKWNQREQSQQPHHINQEESLEFEEATMGYLAIRPEFRCTTDKLEKYINRISHALKTTTEFTKLVAYINGLAKIEKPEVLPELIGYVNGTEQNLHRITEHGGEDKQEAIEFVRKVAIISLRDIAHKYPKEVNPIVRVIVQNTTEEVQTRVLAFDVWMNTQPAQWEVEKIMQVANKDTSLELTHYIYTAFKTAMHSKQPCDQTFARRVRDAWTQIRPFDFGMEFSHLRAKSYYDFVKNYGIRGIWKLVASNTTVLPTYTEGKIEQIRGPFMKTLFGAKLLVKGGDKIWEELTGKDGLLERVSHALEGQMKQGERREQTEQLLKDIASQVKFETEDETPKAVLFWRLFSGEAIIPLDKQRLTELKNELVEFVHKFGKEGVSGHYMRIFVPTKAFHVEPSTIGLPIVHSTIHPIIVSIRFENIHFNFKNTEGRVVPETFELSGTIYPTILSLRQSRVFVTDVPTEKAPTVKVSNIKEAKFPLTFSFTYDREDKEVKTTLKPHMHERIYHSGHCTELNLEQNVLVDEQPMTDGVDYKHCIKNLIKPIHMNKEWLGVSPLGMTIKMSGVSHQPWAGLSFLGSKDVRRDGVIAGLLNRFANKGMKHEAFSLYLEDGKQQPINEWQFTFDFGSNIEQLAQKPLSQQAQKEINEHINVQKEHDDKLSAELQQLIHNVEQQLKKYEEEIDGTTIEKQMLVKIEGRYNGKVQRELKAVMKRIFNFEKTEQQLAVTVQADKNRSFEIFANVSYPRVGSPFHYDPKSVAEDELVNGTLVVKMQGQNDHMIRVNFNATKTEEQRRQEEEQRQRGYDWFETQCMADQQDGRQNTDACKKAILKDQSLDRMQMTVELGNQMNREVEGKINQLAHKLLSLIKYKFYSHMESDITGRQWQGQKEARRIEISANATRVSPWSLLYNIRVEMPRENMTLWNMRLPGVRPPHMQLTIKQQLAHVMFRGQKETPCVLGARGVRTYDNVTFGLETRPGCEYVLTRDVSTTTPDFTVTFSVVNPETWAKKVRVQLANTQIELHPFQTHQRTFHVTVNGTQHEITYETPIVFHYAAGKKVFIHAYETVEGHAAPIVQIYTESKEVTVQYDGQSAKVFVDNKYKGTTRGVCGNNDNEKNHEFVGPHGKEYFTPREFIASYGLTENCRVPVEGKYLTQHKGEYENDFSSHHQQGIQRQMESESDEDDEGNNWDSSEEQGEEYKKNMYKYEQQQQRDEGYMQKTAAVAENGLMCFSEEPVQVCRPGYMKVGIAQKIQMNYICVEPSRPLAREAIKIVKGNGIVNIEKLQSESKGTSGQMVAYPICKLSH
jgi:hypothetical protein